MPIRGAQLLKKSKPGALAKRRAYAHIESTRCKRSASKIQYPLPNYHYLSWAQKSTRLWFIIAT